MRRDSILAFASLALLVGCGGRSGIDLLGASSSTGAPFDAGRRLGLDAASPGLDGSHVPEAAALDAAPDGGGPDAAPCTEQPWVVFSLSTAGPDQGPLSFGVYARHPDGTGGHEVTLPRVGVATPAVSPDGKSIVYSSLDGTQLYVYRFGAASDVTLDTLLSSAGGNALNQAALSPDGATVVYSYNGQGFMALAPVSGASTGGATFGPAGSYRPFFAGRSNLVLFADEKGDILDINLSPGAPGPLVLLEGSGSYVGAAFSPDDNSLVVLTSCDQQEYAVRVVPFIALSSLCAEGTIVAELSPGGGFFGVSWGPTDAIAYSDGVNVWVVPSTGGTPTNLTADLTADGGLDPRSANYPTWAPACTPL